MSRTSKRLRSIVITVIAVAATNFAISFASGVPTMPDAPRPKSGVPTMPDAPRPKVESQKALDNYAARSGVPTMPDAPRP